MAVRTVGVRLTAEANSYLATVGKAAAVTQKLGDTAKATGTTVERAAQKRALAERRVADAAGRLRVAEAQLQQMRVKGNATSAQMVRAQENVARSSRQLVAAQKEAAAAANAVKAASDREAKSLQQLDDGSKKAHGSIRELSTTAGLLGAGLLVGVGAVLKSAAGFDKAMSSVAATGADASKNIEGLRKEAIAMGAATKFSATEAAQGIENLLKAGVSTTDVLNGGLRGALDLAAAGSLEVGDAAEIAATAMTQFGLSGAQIPHVADLLAAGAGKAQGEVKDIGDALKMSGLVANQFGISIEETTGTLAAFASAGLLGSDAGTSFKQMLLQLAAPSDKAASTMEDLGISAYDANGNFVTMSELAGQLSTKMSGLSEKQRDHALAVIFGSDAVRAANVLFNQGASGISDWTKKVNDAGYAAQVARTKMDNLSGDLETLKGSIETTFIVAGSGANEALRGLAQEATRAVNAIGQMPAPVLETGVKLTALAGVGLLAFAGISKLTVGLSETHQAMANLRVESPRLAKGLSVVSKAAGVAAAALVAMQVAGAVANEINGKFVPSVDDAAGALLRLGLAKNAGQVGDLDKFFTISTDTVDTIDSVGEALHRATDPRFTDRLGSLIDKFAGTQDTLTKTRLNIESVDKALASLSTEQAADAFRRMAIQARASGVPVTELVDLFPQYANKVRDAANATGHNITSQKDMANAMMMGVVPASLESATALGKAANKAGGLSLEAKQAKKQLKEMTDALFGSARAALELQGSEDGLEAAIDDATKSVKDNGRTLDKNTEKGRNNRASLRNLAEASIAYREKLIEQGAKQEKVTRTTEEARKKFIVTAKAMGLDKDEAAALADKFGLLDRKIDSVDGQTVKIKFQADTKWKDSSGVKWSVNLSAPGRIGGVAQGGLIEGPGTGTSDSILGIDANGVPTARVSNGEFVVNKKSTDRYRPLIEDINAGRLASGGYVDLDMDRHGLKPANSVPGHMVKARDTYAREFGERIAKEMKGYIEPKYPGGGNLPGGGRAIGRGMGAVFRYANMLGMGHATYPGHGEKSMNKAWDFTPVRGGRGDALAGHAWAHAPAYGIWYVIWNRRIASMTRRGAGWRPYTRYGSNASPSQAHTNHVHISWYGQGTPYARRGLAVVGENGPELVNMRGGEQVRPVSDYRYANSPTMSGGIGGGGGTQIVHHHHINVSVVMPNGGNSEAQAAALGRRIASDLAVKGV